MKTREISHNSTRDIDFADRAHPAAIRIPRPLRDLLRGRFADIAAGCFKAWRLAAANPGEWVGIDPGALVGADDRAAVATLELRAGDGHLDMRVGYRGGALASAIGRRVIAVVPRVPATVTNALAGQPISHLVDAPFLHNPKIIIQRVIEREQARMLDIRCRCPSHVVTIDTLLMEGSAS